MSNLLVDVVVHLMHLRLNRLKLCRVLLTLLSLQLQDPLCLPLSLLFQSSKLVFPRVFQLICLASLDHKHVLSSHVQLKFVKKQPEIVEDVDPLFDGRLVFDCHDFIEGITHDCDKHVHEDNLQHESGQKEDNPKEKLDLISG